MHIRNLFLFVFIMFLIGGCKFEDVEITDFKNVKLGKTTNKEITVRGDVELSNPNRYKIKIKKYDLELKLNESEFLLQESDAGITIPAKFKGFIPVNISLNKKGKGVFSFETLFVLGEIISNRSVNVEVRGKVKAGAFLLSKTINVYEKRTFKFNRNE